MEVVIGIVVFVFGILQLILFFKLWGMTNDVSEIKKFLIKKSVEKEVLLEAEIVDDNVLLEADLHGWANNVTDAEKIEAMPLVKKLKSEQVIAKVISDKGMEVWDLWFWKSHQNNPDYKLIYYN